ncbi:hypothetical protein, partial [Blastococcus sp. CCUG 61487]|uniref:hypothetical protein n=1 Tax=Blastococcus sp. CCUG 61487 TaxID=1840703 RepID=UPI00113833BA
VGSGGGASADNETLAANIAAQVDATSVSTDTNTGPDISVDQDSGSNEVGCLAAVCNVSGSTGNSADIAADSGDINGSGNISGDAVKAATGGGGGDVTATQTVTPSATANNASLDLGGLLGAQNTGSGGAGAGNDTTAINAAVDVDLTDVSTNANTGADIDVDQTSGNNYITCVAAVCNINANTGNTANITVQTGDINDSANIGGHAYKHGFDDGYKHGYHDGHKAGHHHGDDCPEHHKAVAPAPKKHTVAPVTHRAATTKSAAQPKGQLASTGAETTAPLALGLIALGAGGALTLAGRRRSTTAAA